ncbi:hypothetical protein [Amycolatopsis rubida]|uniref:Uncharacterized protein n=1 Tax=Amycolatopsis rubida TaxID=112413 RepID=A0A1I5E4I9_9PSEU|nr:hypothetical protein [Amycolatopsis rubida]SFO06418.1 hypothetical protein SAMN05421854_101494 [Amycolatopsis rubida]
MTTIDGASPTNPDEAPRKSPNRVPRVTLVIHNAPAGLQNGDGKSSNPAPKAKPSAVTPSVTASKRGKGRGGRHELADTTWLGRLERLLQSWPVTLRLALLIVVVLTGTAAIAATLGIGGQLALVVLSLAQRRGHRACGVSPGRAPIPGGRSKK